MNFSYGLGFEAQLGLGNSLICEVEREVGLRAPPKDRIFFTKCYSRSKLFVASKGVKAQWACLWPTFCCKILCTILMVNGFVAAKWVGIHDMIVNVGKVRMKIPWFSCLHNFGPDEIFESGGSGSELIGNSGNLMLVASSPWDNSPIESTVPTFVLFVASPLR